MGPATLGSSVGQKRPVLLWEEEAVPMRQAEQSETLYR